MKPQKNEFIRFLKFGVVGAIGTVIDFGLMNLFFLLFSKSTSLSIESSRLIASIISFVVAVLNNFFLNRIWTYADIKKKAIGIQLAQFSIISVVGLLIRTPMISFLANAFTSLFQKMEIDLPVEPVIAGNNIALAIAIVIVLLWNFFANRLWTFRAHDE